MAGAAPAAPRRSLVWLWLAMLAALAVLLTLGAWQWQRRAEKAALLATLRAAGEAAPLALTAADLATLRVAPWDARALAPGELREFTRVRVAGTLRPDLAVPVRATLPSPTNRRSLGGLGFWWMVPLAADADAPPVFINRGFVPVGADGRPPQLAAESTGTAVITGYLRVAEARFAFVPEDDPARREFFVRDPTILARAAALPAVLPFTIDQERTGDALTPPVGVDIATLIGRIPDNHLQYALTWWGLAATLVGVFGAVLWQRRRRPGHG
jgi:surfeit locus 1 family protein